MGKKYVSGFAMVLGLCVFLTGAASAGQWAKTYGVTGSDTSGSIWPDGSGNYYLSGSTMPVGGHIAGLFAKLSSTGTVSWAKTFGGANADDWLSIDALQSGAFLVSGPSTTFNGFVFAKYSVSGSTWTPVFQKVFKDASAAGGINQTSDGGFLFSGSHDYAPGDSDMLFFKTDSSGNIVWQMDYNYNTGDSVFGATETSDGYLVSTSVSTSNPYVRNTLIMKLAKGTGVIQWRKMLSSTSESVYAGGFFKTMDGNYILSGAVTPPPSPTNPMPVSKGLLVKINPSNGNVVWTKTYSSSTSSIGVYPIKEYSDGSLVLSGGLAVFNTQTYTMTFNPLVMKINSTGGILWKKKYSGSGINMASIFKAPTGEIILSGSHTASSTSTNDDLLYGKLDPTTFAPIWVKTFGGARSDSGNFMGSGTTHWLSGETGTFGGATDSAMKAFGVILDANGNYANCSYVKAFSLSVTTPSVTAAAISLTQTSPTVTARTFATVPTSITLTPKAVTLPVGTICGSIASPEVQSPDESAGDVQVRIIGE